MDRVLELHTSFLRNPELGIVVMIDGVSLEESRTGYMIDRR